MRRLHELFYIFVQIWVASLSSLFSHELPVTCQSVRILEDSDDVVVVDKPSSIPVHPCGKYRFNSLTFILAKEHGMLNLRSESDLRPKHATDLISLRALADLFRIDRMTSGVVMFSKTQGRARDIIKEIANRNTEKTYLARVDGEFPEYASPLRDCSILLQLNAFVVAVSGESWIARNPWRCLM